MTDWQSVPSFGERIADAPATVRPSAYGIIDHPAGRVAVVRTPLGLFLPGCGSDETELPEATETREQSGLAVRVGAWRRTAIEHVSSVTEREQFEKRSTFCNAVVFHPVGVPTETDHALEWMPAIEAATLLTPASHRWAVKEWLTSRAAGAVGEMPSPAV